MDAISHAVAERVKRESAILTEVLDKLRGAIDDYQAVALGEIQTRVANAVLCSLGAPPSEMPDTSDTRASLTEAIRQVESMLQPSIAVTMAVPTTQTSTSSTTADPPPVTSMAEAMRVSPPASQVVKTTPKVGPEVYDRVKTLTSEIAELSEGVSTGSVSRELAFHWISALIAETRLVMTLIPPTHNLNEAAGKLVSRLSALRTKASVHEFVLGLAFGATGDWSRISQEHRRKMGILIAPRAEKKTEAKAKPAESASFGSAFDWPELPSLRKAIEGRTMLVISGKPTPEKADLCQKRFGLVGDWLDVEDAPRTVEAACQRIRSGKVGAVVILEGFLPHKTYDRIVEACKAKSVAFALADRGGIGSFATAFKELDERTAA